MFCPFCGTELPDDSKFCSGCGAQVDFEDNMQEEIPAVPNEMGIPVMPDEMGIPVMPEMPEDPFEKKKKGGKLAVLIAVLVVVIAGAGIAGFLVWNHMQDAEEDIQLAVKKNSGDSRKTESDSPKAEDVDSEDSGSKAKDNSGKDEEPEMPKESEEKKSEEKKVEEKYDPTEGGVHRYEYIVADRTWEEAFADCISRGGYMVHINSREEYDHIINEINQKQLNKIQFFLGGRRTDSSQEYYWIGKDGLPYGEQINTPSYWCASEWLTGEPSYVDGSVQEMYLDILYHQNSGKWVWNDAPNDIIAIVPYFSGKIGYICEYED